MNVRMMAKSAYVRVLAAVKCISFHALAPQIFGLILAIRLAALPLTLGHKRSRHGGRDARRVGLAKVLGDLAASFGRGVVRLHGGLADTVEPAALAEGVEAGAVHGWLDGLSGLSGPLITQ